LILAPSDKPDVEQLAAELEPWLAERLKHVQVRTDVLAYCTQRERDGSSSEDTPDLVVVLGGDGSLLGAVRAFAQDPVPTLGIHAGRVGFLASTPASRWRETLEGLLEGEGRLELRTRLLVKIEGAMPATRVALNEVTIQRGSHQGMLTVALSFDEDWVTDYRADGLIVATPSGSTAYSLSAGGPILEPSVSGFVVTPICSQGLSNRPIVVSDKGELELTLQSTAGISSLAIDGQAYHMLRQGETVRISRHPVPYPLFAMPELDPYRRLRDRLGWRGSP